MDRRRERIDFLSSGPEDTLRFGESFGSQLTKNQVVAFFGDLGAGKTTFIKGIAKGAAKVSSDEVVSPTFTYLNVYSGPTVVYHFDLYRIPSEAAFLGMGFHEYLSCGGICLIEWAEHILSLLPEDVLRVCIESVSETVRKISVYP